MSVALVVCAEQRRHEALEPQRADVKLRAGASVVECQSRQCEIEARPRAEDRVWCTARQWLVAPLHGAPVDRCIGGGHGFEWCRGVLERQLEALVEQHGGVRVLGCQVAAHEVPQRLQPCWYVHLAAEAECQRHQRHQGLHGREQHRCRQHCRHGPVLLVGGP